MDIPLRPMLTLLTVAALAASMVPSSRWGQAYWHTTLVLHGLTLILAVTTCVLPSRRVRGIPRATGPILLSAVAVGVAIHAAVYAAMGWTETRAAEVAYVVTVMLAGIAAVGAWRVGPVQLFDALLGPLVVALVGEGVLCGAHCWVYREWAEWGMHLSSLAGFATVIALVLGAGRGWWMMMSLIAILFVAGAALRLDAVLGVPNPGIDVYQGFQSGVDLLLSGSNPYPFYQQSQPPDFKPLPFYPPLPLLLMVPFRALGLDLRLAIVTLDLVAAFCLYRAVGPGRNEAVRLRAALLTACYLFFPRTPMMFQQAWYEPMLAGCLAVGLSLVRGGHRWGFLLVGLALVGKQFCIVLLPVLLRAYWRQGLALMLGVLVAAVVTIVPFYLWNPEAFREVVFDHHLQLDVRLDANTLQAAMIHLFELPPPRGVFLLISAVLIGLIVWRTPSDGTCPTVWMAAALLAFFFFHSQAFYNYFHLCQYLFLFGLACEPFESSSATIPLLKRLDFAGPKRQPEG
jgi:Glycosyltransferase family 87